MGDRVSFRTRLAAIVGGRAISKAVQLVDRGFDAEGFEQWYRQVSDPISFTGNIFGGNVFRGMGSQPRPEALLRETLGWSAVADRAISNRISTLEPEVVRKRSTREGTEEIEIVDDHPLMQLLDHGWVNHSRRNAFRLMAQYIVTIGQSYTLKLRSQLPSPIPGVGLTTGLSIMLPTNIFPRLEGGLIVGYVVRDGNGREHILDAEDVIRAWLPDPETLYSSEGFLGGQATTSDASKFASEHLRTHYERDATPTVALEPDANATMPTELERRAFDLKWLQRYSRRTGSRVGVPAWSVPGFKFKEFKQQTGAEMVPLLEHWQRQILGAYGVPRAVIGDVQDANRANMESAQFGFDLFTIKPLADLISDAITNQLAVPEYGTEISVRWKEYIAKDKEFLLSQEKQDLETKVRSVNMVLADRGEDEVEWGELPIGSFADVPYTGKEPEPFEPDDPNALDGPEPDDDPDDPDGSAARTGGITHSHSPQFPRSAGRHPLGVQRTWDAAPAAEWQRVLDRERLFVPGFRRAWRAILKAQQKQTMAIVERVIFDRGLFGADDRSDRVSARGPDEIGLLLSEIAGVFEPEASLELFELTVERVRRGAFLRSGQDAIKSVGGDAFVFSDEVQAQLLGQAAEFRAAVNSTTVARLADRILDANALGMAAGEALASRAKRIQAATRGAFEMRRRNAVTIARTEMLRATQRGQLLGFEQSGVKPKKQWNTSLDDAVRDSHRIDGQTRELAEPFELPPGPRVGTELAEAPGVGFGTPLSAGNVIGCRCFVTPVT